MLGVRSTEGLFTAVRQSGIPAMAGMAWIGCFSHHGSQRTDLRLGSGVRDIS
jgi:hypothetical protein